MHNFKQLSYKMPNLPPNQMHIQIEKSAFMLSLSNYILNKIIIVFFHQLFLSILLEI